MTESLSRSRSHPGAAITDAPVPVVIPIRGDRNIDLAPSLASHEMTESLSHSRSYPGAAIVGRNMTAGDRHGNAGYLLHPPLSVAIPIRGDRNMAARDRHGNDASYLRRLLDNYMQNCLRRLLDNMKDCLVGLGDLENYKNCAFSCFYFLCCHAIVLLVLNVCCCSCLRVMFDRLAPVSPVNRTQKFFTFVVKLLSNLWVTALIVLIAWSVLFQPFHVKPHLGSSTVHEFELQSPTAINMASSHTGTAAPHLRFNLTTYLLFKNEHKFYNIRYNHLAVAVFYADEKLGPVDDVELPFKQKPHRRNVIRQVFVGRLRNASSAVAETFARERLQRRFELTVRIRVSLAYKFWPLKSEYFNVYDCPLSSRAPQIGEPALQSPSAWCKTLKI